MPSLFDEGKPNDFLTLLHKAIELHSDDEKTYRYINVGFVLYMDGKTEETIIALQKAIGFKKKATPEEEAAVFLNRQPAKTPKTFDKVTQLVPDNAQTHIKLGINLCHDMHFMEAATSFRKAIELDPRDIFLAHMGLGWALWETGRRKDAICAMQKVIEIEPELAELRLFLGHRLLDDCQFEEAAVALRGVTELDPENVEAYVQLGYVLIKFCRFEEAISALRKAIELDPKNDGAYFNLGCALNKDGQLKEAIDAYRRAAELDPH